MQENVRLNKMVHIFTASRTEFFGLANPLGDPAVLCIFFALSSLVHLSFADGPRWANKMSIARFFCRRIEPIRTLMA